MMLERSSVDVQSTNTSMAVLVDSDSGSREGLCPAKKDV
jgi:hypothetical protein